MTSGEYQSVEDLSGPAAPLLLQELTQAFPRVLVLDPTAIASPTATGQFKAMLFDGWPSTDLMQVTSAGPGLIKLHWASSEKVISSRHWHSIIAECRRFAPDLIYCRPDDFAIYHLDVTVRILNALDQPAVLHIMDDWHGVREREVAENFRSIDTLVRYMMQRCTLRYTDGQAYINEYAARFDVQFTNLLNGIDLDVWQRARPTSLPTGPFILTHMGNLEPDMSRQAVIDIAAAVEELAREVDIRFDVHVRDYILDEAQSLLGRFSATQVKVQSPGYDGYVSTLCASSANLYAYNKDPASVQYIGKGIPNKTCEVLAAGRPVLAYGSEDLACIRYMKENRLAHVITDDSREHLIDEIRRIWRDRDVPDPHVSRAQAFIREHHNKAAINQNFRRDILELAKMPRATPTEIGCLDALDALHLRKPPTEPAAMDEIKPTSGSASIRISDTSSFAIRPSRLSRGFRILSGFTRHLLSDWLRHALSGILFLSAFLLATVPILALAGRMPRSPSYGLLTATAVVMGTAYVAFATARYLYTLRDRLYARFAARMPFLLFFVQGMLNFLRRQRRTVALSVMVGALSFGTGSFAAFLLASRSEASSATAWVVFAIGLALAAAACLAVSAAAVLYGLSHALRETNRMFIAEEVWRADEQRKIATDAKVASLQSEIENVSVNLRSEVANVERSVVASQERTVAAQAALSNLERQMAVSVENLEQTMNSIPNKLMRSLQTNRASYQVFGRFLSEQECEHIVEKWGAALGVPLKSAQIAYFAHRIEAVENLCVGRLATEIESAVIRALVVWSLRGKGANVIEIGTLFGVSMAAIYDICRFRFDDFHLTVIDPLDGYYAAGANDILTQMPVTQQVLEANFARVGVSLGNYRIVRGKSETPAVIRQAMDRKYDVLIVDGDHSFEGVKNDFDNYAPLVKEGGYVLFDDYGDPEWDGVRTFVDDHVMPRKDWKLVGIGPRTAVFKFVATADEIAATPEVIGFASTQSRG